MAMQTRQILNAVSGSGRSPFFLVEDDRIDLHVLFNSAGGTARLVASADGVNYAPLNGVPELTSSIVYALDLAEGTYLAVEYTSAVNLSASVIPYRFKQL